MEKKLILIILLGVVTTTAIVFLLNNKKFEPALSQTLNALSNSSNSLENEEVSLYPRVIMPFADLTIPYLRTREYESHLGELEKYQDHATYTSYLTSYDSDDLKIKGLLTQPKGEMPAGGWPAIVFVHGYIPPTIYKTTEKYVEYVDNLARNGFVVFKIDLRGNGESEGTPSGAYFSGDYIVDTLNAYTALQHTEFVNPSRIGLWGHSMAGNVVLRSFAAKPEIPAVVIWAGAVYSYGDQLKYGINDNSYRPPTNNAEQQNKRKQLMEQYGQFVVDSPFWKLVAPTNYLNDLKGSIQLNHATDDTVVNIGYSRDLNSLLDQTTVPHELNEYPSGGHNITGASFSKAMSNTVRFYKQHLAE
ncbi:MAG: alpha/beta fold hydrolase [Patescibacteria group bacterium]